MPYFAYSRKTKSAIRSPVQERMRTSSVGLANHWTVIAAVSVSNLGDNRLRKRTFSLAILAEKRRVANDAVKDAFEAAVQLQRLGEVVGDELFENGEAVVELEESDLWTFFLAYGGLRAFVDTEATRIVLFSLPGCS